MTTTNKPYNVRASQIRPDWHVIDASNRILGRLASEIAILLQGKHKPLYTPHLLTGDFVVVTNASKIKTTANKPEQKTYYRHTNYPGGLRKVTLDQTLEKHPDRVIKHAVRGMLPHNKLGRHMLTRLKVYPGDSHPHEAQVRGSLKARNIKTEEPVGKEEA
ncbi:MAG: 50S ribosomal protein L13 [Chloroflexi bacterium]|nr:50S ribosomal protein L13 [Chloroflexota bacterium]